MTSATQGTVVKREPNPLVKIFSEAEVRRRREVGLDEEGWLEVAHIVGIFNYFTRRADGGTMTGPDGRVLESALL